ncbi:MAG TPA: BMP family ABC transporter substrate-binding protein [Acidimicrobiales bacterium]|jgi:basic membrane protein A|nr:BMP family ABC transporter substrate-binding protein [Acidimicrobiales bacterium]
MSSLLRLRSGMLAAAALGLVMAGCGSTSKTGTASTTSGTASTTSGSAATGSGPWGWPGSTTQGYLPPHEPDVDHDGKVVVGLLTAGDIHDHGYYQSEVDTMNTFKSKYGWKTIVVANVNPAAAAEQADNMCRQPGMDLVLIGQSELAAAAPAASSSVCKGIPFWAYASAGTMKASPYYYLAEDFEDPQLYVTGVAMGLWLEDHHQTTAGFVAGPALSFTERPARGLLAGMRSIVPNAQLLTTFTGDFNASGPAITAAQAMVAKGVKLLFPYLGGALFPVADYANSKGVTLISDGGEFCSLSSPKFAINAVYNPGYYLQYALQDFAQGKMRVGTTKQFNFGLTPVPTVQFCNPTGAESNQTLNALMSQIGSGQLNPTPKINATPQP